MEIKSNAITGAVDASPPRGVRFALFGGLFLLVASAAYLISVRGEALIVDLASMGGRGWCF